MLFPVFLNLSAKSVCIVGAGEVGRRKLLSLGVCPVARISVYDVRDPDPELAEMLNVAGAEFFRLEEDELPDLEGYDLVFIATSNHDTNRRLFTLCRRAGVMCNVADAPLESDFILPAVSRSGRLTAAFSTDGGSPALSRRLRNEADIWLDHYARLADVLARIRARLLRLNLPQAENARILRSLVWSDLGERLADKEDSASESLLRDILPSDLHPAIPEFLHGPV